VKVLDESMAAWRLNASKTAAFQIVATSYENQSLLAQSFKSLLSRDRSDDKDGNTASLLFFCVY